MSFYNLYHHGLARVAAANFEVSLANPKENTRQIIEATRQAVAEGACVVAFPEMSLTGYTVGDLVKQDPLLQAVAQGISDLAEALADLPVVVVVGAPLRQQGKVFNCAVTISQGEILSVTPKLYLPTADGSEQSRLFNSGSIIESATFDFLTGEDNWAVCGHTVTEITDVPGLKLCAVVGGDAQAAAGPAELAAGAGATLIVNIAAEPATIGHRNDREAALSTLSAKTHSACLFVNTGANESSNDFSFDGHALIYENGVQLASSQRFADGLNITYADIDPAALQVHRSGDGVFIQSQVVAAQLENLIPGLGLESDSVTLGVDTESDFGLRREVARFPFVPNGKHTLDEDCREAFEIQTAALVRRMRTVGNPKLVLGVSGGLDSTHALLVCVQAMEKLGRPRTDVMAYTLPGFATTAHTKSNAQLLAESLGVSFQEIDIRPAAMQMLGDMDHPAAKGEEVYDVTFENVQAGLRADYLFRLANHVGGMVIGTGDLSEGSLGWCTYGVGDHISHYNVNPGIPKTMMQHLIRWVIRQGIHSEETNKTLQSILDTEVTPELIPTREGEVPQSTAASVGPYELHDFTLHYYQKAGAQPGKIAFLEWHAWHDANAGQWPAGYPEDKRMQFSLEEIFHWLEAFYRRHFASQFKRTCATNGPAVSPAGGLSPRGGWVMPCDATAATWLDALAVEKSQALGE